ncbi:hypothetical protein MMC30_001055 [Trapelia coarctata]|nr:hypothetical protein [Trapelia coarctata]
MHIVPLSPSLISPCAAVTRAAFGDDELFEWLLPHRFTYPAHWQQSVVNRLHMRLNSPGMMVRVALSDKEDEWWDESVGSEVLGYTIWERNGKWREYEAVWGKDGLAKKFERFAAKLAAKYSDLLHIDQTVDYEHMALYRAGSSAYDKVMDDQIGKGGDHIWLTVLGVDPRFQRKGIGKRLLRWGLKRSDEEGVPIGLCASPVGCKLYRSVGFEDAGILEIEGLPIKDVTMVRWPNGIRDASQVSVEQ